MRKSKYLILVCVVLSFWMCMLSSCINPNSQGNQSEMKLDNTNISLNVGESVAINVSNAVGSVKYEIDNTSVAQMDGNVVYAKAEGTATITVSDSKTTLTCKVTVVEDIGDMVYYIDTEVDVIDLLVGESFTLIPELKIGNKSIFGATFSYSSNASHIADAVDGRFVANKVGVAYITITSNDKENVSKVIEVIVHDNLVINLSALDVVLTKSNIDNYSSQVVLKTSVMDDNELIEDPRIYVSIEDDSVVDVVRSGNNFVVSSKNFGTTKITFTYLTPDGESTAVSASVSVVKPTIEYDGTVLFSKSHGKIITSSIDLSSFGVAFDTDDLVSVTDKTGKVYSVASLNQNDIYLTDSYSIVDDGSKQGFVLDMGYYNLELDVSKYTLVIENTSDFISMRDHFYEQLANDGQNHKMIKGYYYLATDLDFSGVAYETFAGNNQIDPSNPANGYSRYSGFNGVFEGNDHIIKNLKVGSDTVASDYNSIFGNIGYEGVIRNVAFVDCSLGEKATGGIVAGYVFGKISNVFVSGTVNSGFGTDANSSSSVFADRLTYSMANIQDITVVAKNTLQGNNYVLSYGNGKIKNPPAMDGVVLIGGGSESQFAKGYASAADIKSNISTGSFEGYISLEDAVDNKVSSVGSTTIQVENGVVTIRFNGVIVYTK